MRAQFCRPFAGNFQKMNKLEKVCLKQQCSNKSYNQITYLKLINLLKVKQASLPRYLRSMAKKIKKNQYKSYLLPVTRMLRASETYLFLKFKLKGGHNKYKQGQIIRIKYILFLLTLTAASRQRF